MNNNDERDYTEEAANRTELEREHAAEDDGWRADALRAAQDAKLVRPYVLPISEESAVSIGAGRYLTAARAAALGVGPQPEPARISGWHFEDGQADAVAGSELPDNAGWWVAVSEGKNFRLRAHSTGLKIVCGACGAEEWVSHDASYFDLTALMLAIHAHRDSRHYGQTID